MKAKDFSDEENWCIIIIEINWDPFCGEEYVRKYF